MITHLRARNFKSWEDTGPMRIAPLTALFGANSSGKTAILQLLLMLKQTVESADRSMPLQIGGPQSYADLGTFRDLVYGHTVQGTMAFEVGWSWPEALTIADPGRGQNRALFVIKALRFAASIEGSGEGPTVSHFEYQFESQGHEYRFGMLREEEDTSKASYELTYSGFKPKMARGRKWPLPPPVKSYGFPNRVNADYQDLGFLSGLVLEFEKLFGRIFYLGPLRQPPLRRYPWGEGSSRMSASEVSLR